MENILLFMFQMKQFAKVKCFKDNIWPYKDNTWPYKDTTWPYKDFFLNKIHFRVCKKTKTVINLTLANCKMLKLYTYTGIVSSNFRRVRGLYITQKL